MSRHSRGNKEYTRLQEALYENKRLKREISRLNKQLAHLDLDRHSYVKDIVDEHLANEDREETTVKMLERLKEEWRCHEGGCDGYLEIVIYSKMGNPFYFRQCSHCANRTVAKPYDSSIGGIRREVAKQTKFGPSKK